MAKLPRTFRSTLQREIASFDSQDVLTGTAYKIFYPLRALSGSRMVINSLDSQGTVTDVSVNGAAAKKAEVDFDVEIGQTGVMEGEALVTVTNGLYCNSNDSTTTYLVIKLRKYDGTTETDLDTHTGTTITLSSATASSSQRETHDFDISRTVFRKGDIFRVTVEIWGSGADADSVGWFAHDPNGRTDVTWAYDGENTDLTNADSHSTTMEVELPFAILG